MAGGKFRTVGICRTYPPGLSQVLVRAKAREGGIVEDRGNPVDLAQTSASEPVLQVRAKRALLQGIQPLQQRFQFAHLLAAEFDSRHASSSFARISNRKCNLALDAATPQPDFVLGPRKPSHSFYCGSTPGHGLQIPLGAGK